MMNNHTNKEKASALSRPPDSLLLVLNAGSSSLKFAVYSPSRLQVAILSGSVRRIGLSTTQLVYKLESVPSERKEITAPNHDLALDGILEIIASHLPAMDFVAVGHRIVHDGGRYGEPTLVNPEMIAHLRTLEAFAPGHLGAEIAILEILNQRFPSVPQVACFDTGFHRDLPRVARLLAIPLRFEAEGVRRYGFHGLSYQFLMEELARLGDPAVASGRVILAHLGNGASMAAVQDGKCIDTSMGFSPAGGLMMGSRSGDIDPGLLAYLGRNQEMTTEGLERLFNGESGLLGVSEISSDMEELLANEETDHRAATAIALFCYQAKKWLGSFTAALGGVDTIVFSGGIGEHNPSIRSRICEGLGFLGVEIDPTRNSANAILISPDSCSVEVRVISTNEEQIIAENTCRVLGVGEPVVTT